jgi:DNA-binding NarL/FixJ family response regulator
MPDAVKVLIIENQSLTRLGVRTLIDKESDIELAGEADNAADGFAKVRHAQTRRDYPLDFGSRLVLDR